MSFTSDVKHEISQLDLKECCKKAELSALIKLCSTLNITNSGLNLLIKSENATIAKRIWSLLRELYDVETSLSVVKKMNLKKNNIYNIRVLNKVKDILLDLCLYSNRGLLDVPLGKIVLKECCAKAYLAGAFMASGSVNAPQKTNYHLEISTNSFEHAQFIIKLMERFNLPSKNIVRRGNHVVYLKAADKIADFLKVIGAFNALMKYEDIRIGRDFKNSLVRLDNCEVANEMKTMKAAKNQLDDIGILERTIKIENLDIKLQEVIKLRKNHPELSLNELSEAYTKEFGVSMSKSGMKHRFTKIHELALKQLEREKI
ncbi:MAG: DNA-binding protein WhiA [Erysipelotrichaceae bacterium]|nr:DNA-binding protein WhiA [Erysipelotrichaceae bacterium]